MSKVFKKVASLTLATALMGSLVSCAGSNTVDPTQLQDDSQISSVKKAGQKKWTILVHLAADNNLYGFGLKDMSEMAYGLTNDKDVNVVVLWDGSKTGDSAVYEITHSDKKPAMNAPITSKKVTDSGLIPANNEIDSGDPKLFAKFMDWATQKYPADHTGVIIWNHGSGIFRGQPKELKNASLKMPEVITQKGFAWDDHGGNMNLKDLNPALDLAVKNTGKKLDFLDFDACLMAHVEAAYQIKDHVNYLIASEKTEAGDGNDYWGITENISKNPGWSGKDFATDMVKGYEKSYKTGGHQYTGRPEEYTLSATDTAAVATGLAPAINDLGLALSADPSAAKQAWASATTYDGDPEPRDLGDFLKFLSRDSKAAAFKSKIDRTNEELKKAVVAEVHTGKATNALEDSTGLVLYIPGPGGRVNAKYTNPAEMTFAQNTGWTDFLKKFVAIK